MIVGIDFDNTLVCYDGLAHRLAVERGLIPEAVPPFKAAVRDALRAAGREPEWTELQGQLYGPRILEAAPFPGALDAVADLTRRGNRVCVISHKTRFPYLGSPVDLHKGALHWLAAHGLCGSSTAVLGPGALYFEPTKQAKLSRIASLGCDWFVDDLPEFLLEPSFPAGVRRVLFDPRGAHADHPAYRRAGSWQDVRRLVLGVSSAA